MDAVHTSYVIAACLLDFPPHRYLHCMLIMHAVLLCELCACTAHCVNELGAQI